MRWIALFFACCFVKPIWSQSASELGWMPGLVVSYDLSDSWKITAQAESRQNTWQRRSGETFKADYKYVRTDLTAILSYKLTSLWSLSGGYMLRLIEGIRVHRSLQQIAFTQRLVNMRLGHRFRTDQTFFKRIDPEFRFRYRLSAEIPLEGASLNDREWYLKGANEQVASVQSSEWAWEIRLVSNLGYQVNSNLKMETGIDYRVDRLINNRSRHRAWWTVGGYWGF